MAYKMVVYEIIVQGQLVENTYWVGEEFKTQWRSGIVSDITWGEYNVIVWIQEDKNNSEKVETVALTIPHHKVCRIYHGDDNE